MVCYLSLRKLNFNDDGIQARVSNVPFSSHKSFPTEVEAWQYLISHYPHVKPPSANAAILLFVPPTLSLVHPTLYLPT